VSRHVSIRPTDALGARRYEEGAHERRAPPWRKACLFVAAASSPSEGPSASRHAGIHPTDALGARRYEEGVCRTTRFQSRSSRRRPGSRGGNAGGCSLSGPGSRPAPGWHWMANADMDIRGAVGKPARRHPSDRRAWRAPLRSAEHGPLVLPWRNVSLFV